MAVLVIYAYVIIRRLVVVNAMIFSMNSTQHKSACAGRTSMNLRGGDFHLPYISSYYYLYKPSCFSAFLFCYHNDT